MPTPNPSRRLGQAAINRPLERETNRALSTAVAAIAPAPRRPAARKPDRAAVAEEVARFIETFPKPEWDRFMGRADVARAIRARAALLRGPQHQGVRQASRWPRAEPGGRMSENEEEAKQRHTKSRRPKLPKPVGTAE
jgi:hypothetical protein